MRRSLIFLAFIASTLWLVCVAEALVDANTGSDSSSDSAVAKHESDDGDVNKSDMNFGMGTIDHHSLNESIHDFVEGFHESARNIPRIVDEIFGNALFSFDKAAGGLFKDDLRVAFALLKDESACVVRLYIPDTSFEGKTKSAPRRVHASVIGKQHLRLKINTAMGGYTSEVTKTIQLPVKVSKDNVEISSKPDGSVHIKLRVLTDSEAQNATTVDIHESARGSVIDMDSLLGRLFPALFSREVEEGSESRDVVREVPSSDDIASCREKFQHDKLLISKCMCDATAEGDSRAICYGSLISKCVSMARKLGMDEFATSTKHLAIECAAGTEDKAKCLEGVAREILESLYHRKGAGDRYENVSDRIRLAIESEDDGPSQFELSAGARIAKVVVACVLGCAVLWAGVVLAGRRRGRLAGAAGAAKAQLSSVITQRARSSPAAAARVGREGRNGKNGAGQDGKMA